MQQCNTARNPAQVPRLSNAAVVCLARRKRPQAVPFLQAQRQRDRRQKWVRHMGDAVLAIVVLCFGVVVFVAFSALQAVGQ